MNTRLTAALATACLAGAASADITNGGFEANPAYAGWTTSGSVTLSAAAPIAPTEGARCALLTATGASAATLTALIGCTAAELQTEAQTTTAVVNGSAILQTFTIADGESLSFDFRFNNLESANNEEWPDTCFVVINGEPFALASSLTLPSGLTPVAHFSKADIPAGQVTVAFTVINFGDPAVNSQMMVDNIRVAPNTSVGICGAADVGGQGGVAGFDNRLDNNDFVVFIDLFFQHDARADLGSQGGAAGGDTQFDNNDFVAFIDAFFNRLAEGGCI
ncbi:MAG TPA: GC-type dockerin domain-anchored protein [Phycisphaerales bacterium]|nr:GC-type dockerin domain-anchored protein [Phycisphaerales bacterium]